MTMTQQGWVSTTFIILLILAAGTGLYFYQSLHSDLKQLESTHGDALSESKRLQTELSQAQQRLAQRSTSAARLEAQLNETKQSLSDATNTLAALRTQNETLKNRIDELGADLSASQALASSRGDQLIQSEDRMDALSEQLKQRKVQITELLRSSEDLSADLASAREKQSLARTRVDELSQKLNDAQNSLTRANRELEQREAQIVDLTSSREELKASLTTAREEQDETTARIAELTEDLEATKTALKQARDELTQNEKDLRKVTEEKQLVAEQYQKAREELALQQAQKKSVSETNRELEARLQRERSAMDNLQTRLQALSNEKQTLVSLLEDGTTVIKLPENIVFNSGSAHIGESGRETLQLLATALESFPDHLISVQGHSDSRPIAPSLQDRYLTNWELSGARAASAVRVLRDTGIAPERMQAVGYADTRPVVEETDAASRRMNRRIEVLLYPNRFSVKPYSIE